MGRLTAMAQCLAFRFDLPGAGRYSPAPFVMDVPLIRAQDRAVAELSSEPREEHDLSPHDLSPEERRVALRRFHVQSVGVGFQWALCTPLCFVFVTFALKHIGFSKENVGLASAAASAGGLLQLLSFLVMNRVRHKRAAAVLIASGEMLILALVLLLPVLIPGENGATIRQILFLAAVFTSGAAGSTAAPLIMNWLSAVVPAAARGRYLSTRTLLQALTITIAVWIAGRLLDWRDDSYGMFVILILVGAGAAMLGLLALLRAPMPKLAAEARFSLRDVFASLRHRPFRNYMAFFALCNLPFALACPYYTAFFREEVGLSSGDIAWYVTGYGIVRLLAIKPAGHAVDRWGARPVVALMLLIYAGFFLMFPVFTQARYGLILAIWSVVGGADAVYCVAIPSVLFRTVPLDRNRSSYFALERSVMLVMMALGPLVVRGYFALADDVTLHAAGLTIEKFRIMFFACGIMVLLSLALVPRLPDTHEVRLRGLIFRLFRYNPFAAMRRRFWKPPQ